MEEPRYGHGRDNPSPCLLQARELAQTPPVGSLGELVLVSWVLSPAAALKREPHTSPEQQS